MIYSWSNDVTYFHFQSWAVPWLKLLVAGLSPQMLIHVVFVVDTVKLGQVFYKYFGFPLSISFQQCSTAIFNLSTTDTLSNWQHHQIKHSSVLAVTHHNCYFVSK
jgi:hypothetical protein